MVKAFIPWVAALALAASMAVTAAPEPATPAALPAEAAELVPGARLVGAATYTFFGLEIYDGYYFCAAKNYSPDRPFALMMNYHRHLSGEAIASRSIEEIAKLKIGSAEQRARWEAAMKHLFPDVQPGDLLTGINIPGTGTRFFRNGVVLGTVDDPAFAQAFFAIWFDPRTSGPEFREHLLGE
jgi:hypothetical protein